MLMRESVKARDHKKNIGSNGSKSIAALFHDPRYWAINGQLEIRNIRILRHRTSVRLEPVMWSALDEIASRENCSIDDICASVQQRKNPQGSFTAALRSFIVAYYRYCQLQQK